MHLHDGVKYLILSKIPSALGKLYFMSTCIYYDIPELRYYRFKIEGHFLNVLVILAVHLKLLPWGLVLAVSYKTSFWPHRVWISAVSTKEITAKHGHGCWETPES